ncbi:stranded at second isoform X2 [Andrena cerasifolii]|uniref:stranded at second isoform X2 n=1 Tax=Andrena cerasifolii TaxID=2819439 RepID=UPI004037DFAA
MRIQERCFLSAAAGLCLLGGLAILSAAVDVETTTGATAGVDATEVPGVQPLRAEARNETIDRKSEYPTKEQDSKTTVEPKKKPLDFKVKPDQKYQKSFKDDDAKRGDTNDATTESDDETTARSVETMGVTIPLLLRGEPILATVDAPTSNESSSAPEPASTTEEARMTEETASFRGRALNISAPEPTNSLHSNITDLSDVSMDDDDKEVEGGEYVAPHNETALNISATLLPTVTMCVQGNRTYAVGEKIVKGCEEKCVCGEDGTATDCKPLCSSPYVRANRGIVDPLCQEKLVNEEPCCAILVCAADSAPEPEETCVFANKTIMRGLRVEDGCSRVCVCEAGGILKCQPRCPPNETTTATNQHDRCVVLADPRDSCCTITLCDVTLGDHEIRPETSNDLTVNLTDVKVLNSTAIKLKLSAKNPQDVTVEISDKNHVWRQQKPDKEGIISNLEPAHTYYVRVTEGSRTGLALQVVLPAEVIKTNISDKTGDKGSCSHRGKTYKVGAEWYDECISFCMCSEGGKTECATIECPTDFGLDVLDPHCLDWETVPPNFSPKPPHCCPQEVGCRNNGSCNYEGKTYDNWSELPSNVTGCEKRCYCEMGKVSCQAACPPVPALPPATMPCPSYQVILTHLPGDECCKEWSCSTGQLPGRNATPAFPDPTATDALDRPPIDDRPNNKSGSAKPSQQPDATTHGLFHYPMDPGHPTIPYNGPYNPDYRPTRPSVEDVFHLPPLTEKPPPLVKEKTKSKSDLAKKPVEPLSKPHKDDYFPGPLAPDKFPDKHIPISVHSNENQHLPGPLNPNKLPSPQKPGPPTDQPQFIPLNPHRDLGPGFAFAPINVPQSGLDPQLDNSAVGPAYHGSLLGQDSVDPNVIVPVSPKKKAPPSDVFEAERGKPAMGLPGRPKQGQRNPEQEILPEELYHLINLQHPGLVHLDHGPPDGHPGIFDIHQQISGMEHNVPPGFPLPGAIPGFPVASSSDEVTVQILEALDENTVRLVFTVPQVLVGLHGRVELRYTNDKTNFDASTWKAQVFAPPNDLIATPQLEFELGDLKPSSEYKVKITVKLKDLANSPTSKIYSVRTLEKRAEVTTLPPQIPVDAELRVTETNSTWMNVMWNKFSEYELQFIDGVQLRYKEQDSKVYSGTPLIHRAVRNYVIENLRPSTTYEVGIIFVPFPGQLTELVSEKTIQVTTSLEPNPYSFEVRVEIKTIKSTDVEVTWSGVPYPEDKYVNIYRAIYQSDSGKEDTSTFKMAKRDSHPKTVIGDLKPGTRYRLWLEVYLTNGRIKKSNVQDFVTKPGVLLPATISQQAGKLASLPLHEGDYYGPLVVVAIVASLAILSTLILLMMLMKRRTSSKADISPRKTTSAYDNPSYKVELQQETMDL